MSTIDHNAALIVIDVQRGFDDAAYWGRRDNPQAEANIGRLTAAWQRAGRPIVLVRHDSETPGSPLAAGSPGNAFKPVLDHVEPALLMAKQVNSAFYGEPDLHVWLQERGVAQLVICGIQTNRCAETTARMAGNLGYDVHFALDATHTFDTVGPDGVLVRAEELARATAASLHQEFARVRSTRSLIEAASDQLDRGPA